MPSSTSLIGQKLLLLRVSQGKAAREGPGKQTKPCGESQIQAQKSFATLVTFSLSEDGNLLGAYVAYGKPRTQNCLHLG